MNEDKYERRYQRRYQLGEVGGGGMEKVVGSVTFESTELFSNTTGERGLGWESKGAVGGAAGGPAGGALGGSAEGAAEGAAGGAAGGALGGSAGGAAGGAARKLEFTH
jgi:hypothetical protein